jgi:hypothetical protein
LALPPFNRRKDDGMNLNSIMEWVFKAAVIFIVTMVLKINASVGELVPALKSQQDQINKLSVEMAEIKGQMVTWDTLKRIELTLSDLSARGRGNEAMRAVANTLKVEREGRKE